MSKLFFIDYDNTLFSHHTFKIPQSAVDSLCLLKKLGHKVIIASGRNFRGDLSPLFNHRFTPDCLVSANGAIVEAEGTVLWEKYFDPKTQIRLFDYIREKNYCLMVNYDNVWYTSSIQRYHERAIRPSGFVLPPDDESFLSLYDKPLTSLFLEEGENAIIDVAQKFPELKLLRMGFETGGADIIPKENGKIQGMKRILKYYQASATDTIAIGDSMNDIEMIQYSGLGIAMGNAMSEVKAVADYIAKDIHDDGLQSAIEFALHQMK